MYNGKYKEALQGDLTRSDDNVPIHSRLFQKTAFSTSFVLSHRENCLARGLRGSSVCQPSLKLENCE